MTDKSSRPSPASVDDLMQAMTQLPNLPIAPDTAPALPSCPPVSLREMRVQRAMDEYPGLTAEKAAEIIEAFGF